MPELPEVETTVRGLRSKIIGLTIKDFWATWPRITRQAGGPAFIRREVKGRKILKVWRRAKYIVFDLAGPKSIFIHQKMTGHLLYGKWEKATSDRRQATSQKNKEVVWRSVLNGPLQDSRNQHIRAVFFLSNGFQVSFSDARRFGKIAVVDDKSVLNLKEIKQLGPEPLDISLKDFKKLFVPTIIDNKKGSRGSSILQSKIGTKKKGRIKPVLMDPKFIVGIGNIYADEILWEIGIHPSSRVENIPEKYLDKMYVVMQRILKKSIELKGTSADDYRTPTGEKGQFHNFLKAYQLTGQKCSKKDGGTIQRVVIGARSAHYCDKHQILK